MFCFGGFYVAVCHGTDGESRRITQFCVFTILPDGLKYVAGSDFTCRWCFSSLSYLVFLVDCGTSTNYLCDKMSAASRQVGKITVSRMKPLASRTQSELSGNEQLLAISLLLSVSLFVIVGFGFICRVN